MGMKEKLKWLEGKISRRTGQDPKYERDIEELKNEIEQNIDEDE